MSLFAQDPTTGAPSTSASSPNRFIDLASSFFEHDYFNYYVYANAVYDTYAPVVQNGQTIIDKQEVPGITGGALDSHESQPGPIYLQGSENGQVAYRNIVVTPAAK